MAQLVYERINGVRHQAWKGRQSPLGAIYIAAYRPNPSHRHTFPNPALKDYSILGLDSRSDNEKNIGNIHWGLRKENFSHHLLVFRG